MKSRSHRPPMLEPRHDDWVDGSWTVDCICGVNFDDGEEMVDCDECGVWVHTRCSRYVKSEKSFSCHKCKSKNSVGGLRNDSEETEVAEFLLELPTKTMLDAPNPVTISSHRACKLWTDIPMEKRVHVQGVPGGESGFFEQSKMSSIFGPRLWKCAGYVPKKFAFQYSEFPLVEEKPENEIDKENGERNGDQVNDGAGAFISFLSVIKNPLPISAGDPVPVNCPSDAPVSGKLVSPTQNKKSDFENPDAGHPVGGVITSDPVVLDSTKHEATQNVMLHDQHVKKLKTMENNECIENHVAKDSKAGHIIHASPPIPLASSDAKNLEFSQERGSKASSHSPRECAPHLVLEGHDLNQDNSLLLERKEVELLLRPDSFTKSIRNVKSSTNLVEHLTTSMKEEVPVDSSQSSDVAPGGIGRLGVELPANNPMAGCLITGGLEAAKSEDDQKPDIDMANERPTKKQKCELVDEHSGTESLHHNAMNLNNGKATFEYPDSHPSVFPDGVKLPKTSEYSDSKLHSAFENQNLDVDGTKAENPETSPDGLYGRLPESTSDVSMGLRKKSLKIKNPSEVPDEMVKLNGDSQRHSTSYQRKVGATLVKSDSTSGSTAYGSSDDHVSLDAKNLSTHNRQKELSDGSFGNTRSHGLSDMFEHNAKCERPKKIAKESSGSGFVTKMPDSTKTHASNSRGASSDSKDFSFSTSNLPQTRSVSCTRFSDDGGNQSLALQDKVSVSVVPSKGEKVRQCSGQILSKGNMTSASVSSNVPAALSDEELALLLHQELNSSPRVPRVPRMRHAGSLPQIASSSSTSMLTKRSSSGGRGDQIVSYRKKSKDLSGDASQGYLRANLEAKKLHRKPSSPDNTRQDSASSIDQQSQKEADCGSIKHVQSMKKAYASGLTSDTYGHASFNCPSAMNTTNGAAQMVTCQAHVTLPGLIAEIMSEGKRMTYEDLCDAVLPHWPHLRKHNGERYAYASHSQAVLDCLRNRSEWASLVDRGPKTNAGRKRRKNDADSFSMESENEQIRVKTVRGEGSKSRDSHREDIPKGKRKARKPRGPPSQERGRVMTRGRRSDIPSDYETESSSESTEDDASSEEEEVHGNNDDDGTSATQSDASSGSEATH